MIAAVLSVMGALNFFRGATVFGADFNETSSRREVKMVVAENGGFVG